MSDKQPAFGKPWPKIDPAKSAAHWRKLSAAEELYDALKDIYELVMENPVKVARAVGYSDIGPALGRARAALQKANGGAI